MKRSDKFWSPISPSISISTNILKEDQYFPSKNKEENLLKLTKKEKTPLMDKYTRENILKLSKGSEKKQAKKSSGSKKSRDIQLKTAKIGPSIKRQVFLKKTPPTRGIPKKTPPTPIIPKEISKKTPKKTPKKTNVEKDFKKYLESKGIHPLSYEILNMVDRGENIGSILKKNSMICSLIYNGEIQFGQFINKGAYGEVKNLLFPSDTKKYVVKRSLVSRNIYPCETEVKRVARSDNRGTVSIPKGSLLCDEIVSEFYISVLVSQFLRDRKSINFIDTFFFGTCIGQKPEEYTFMEKIDGGDLENMIKNTSYRIEDIESIYLQTLHSIALYQKEYQIVHSDLHWANIFISKPDNPVDYYEYKIGDKSIYTLGKHIAKIGDWGMAVKYKDKIVGNKYILFGHHYDRLNQDNAFFSNFYNTAYDVAFITFLLNIKLNGKSKLIYNIARWILRDNMPSEIYKMDVPYIGRPLVSNLYKLKHVNPIDILTDDQLMQNYMQRPAGTILRGGVI